MAVILFTADWHIKLNRKNIPNTWQRNRTMLMVDKINNIAESYNVDSIIIGGDILDVANPSPEEAELYYDAISKIKTYTLIYTGNHEMVDNKHSCLFNMAAETNRCNPLVSVVSSMRSEDFDIIDYVELKQDNWRKASSKLCFTHVRGEIPPHVKPEIDLTRFEQHGYSVVYAGDLHANSCSQKTPRIPLLYPGSPFNTSFSRDLPLGEHGVFIIDTTKPTEPIWVELTGLPQLIRKSVTSADSIIPHDTHRVIYELIGDVLSLGKVKKSDLLDKKINTNVTKEASLKGLDGNITKEVEIYCKEILKLSPEDVTTLITELNNAVNMEQYA